MGEVLNERINELDERVWALFAEVAGHNGPCILDLREMATISPGGLVGLVLMTRSRRRMYTNIIAPPKKSPVSGYLGSIDFFHLMRGHGNARFERPIDYSRQQLKPTEVAFTKLLVSESKDYDSTHRVIQQHIEVQYPETAAKLKTVFTEVLNNIRDHAGEDAPPFYCIQVQTYKSGLQLAFGDLGIGFKGSFQRNPGLPAFETEMHALEGAICHGYSSRSHINEERGGGLRHALDHVLKLEGSYRVLSRDGLASASAANPLTIEAFDSPFPGSMVWIDLPSRTAR